MAVFQGGKDSEQIIPMTKGDRGRYSVLIPQGDYSAVSFIPVSYTTLIQWALSTAIIFILTMKATFLQS